MAGKGTARTIWFLIALLGLVAAGVGCLMPWLGLSVDGVSTSDGFVNGIDVAGIDSLQGLVVLGVVGLLLLLVLVALYSGRASGTIAVLLVLGAFAIGGVAAWVYLDRDQTYVQVAKDELATEDLSADTIEKVLEPTIESGGISVDPQTGLIVVAAGAVVLLLGGIGAGLTRGRGSRAAEPLPAEAVEAPEITTGPRTEPTAGEGATEALPEVPDVKADLGGPAEASAVGEPHQPDPDAHAHPVGSDPVRDGAAGADSVDPTPRTSEDAAALPEPPEAPEPPEEKPRSPDVEEWR